MRAHTSIFWSTKVQLFWPPTASLHMCMRHASSCKMGEKNIIIKLNWNNFIYEDDARRTQRIKILIMWQTFWQQFCIVYSKILLIFSAFITFPWIYLLFLFSGYSATRKELQRRIYVWIPYQIENSLAYKWPISQWIIPNHGTSGSPFIRPAS